jgi:cytochrome o ubiquinol oxidase subunit 3
MTHSHTDVSNNTIFGFWVYLMTDFILFATLFATYAVLRNATFGGPTGAAIFHLPYALAETLVLLASTFTCAITMLDKKRLLLWYSLTFFLGLVFFALMIADFSRLIAAGHSWAQSAFLSAYFTLVGTHGLHIFFGLLFMAAFVIQTLQRGLIPVTLRRLTCLNIFWFFSYFVWIFMFTLVYLMGGV